jgi:hypothetical protein
MEASPSRFKTQAADENTVGAQTERKAKQRINKKRITVVASNCDCSISEKETG